MTRLRSRPTTYRGIRMRSRLEAAYAASIDGLCTWAYEPMCFAGRGGQYLPDFRIEWTSHPLDQMWIEIKPTWDQVEAATRAMDVILETLPDARLFVDVPQGEWPNITFHTAARRLGLDDSWSFVAP